MEKRNCDMEKGLEINPEFDFPCDGLETDLGNLKQAQNILCYLQAGKTNF